MVYSMAVLVIEAKIWAKLERIHKSNVGMSEALLD
jgi:hypothetical protein